MIKAISINILIFFNSICSVYAFTCYDATGNFLNSGSGSASANVYVDLTPEVQIGQNLVVDLKHSIFCRNDQPTIRRDLVSMLRGSSYGPVLSNFRGTMKYYNSNYPFPLNSSTHQQNFPSGSFVPWNTQLYLTPISATSVDGVIIRQGTHFATLVMRQVGSNLSNGGNVHTATFTWNLYANNSVVVPTGGCDVSSRNVIVNLSPYPSTANVPLSIHCASNQRISYYLTGTTNSSDTVFANVLSGNNAAKGIGIELVKNNQAIKVRETIRLGSVGSSPVNLGLTARYGLTSETLTSGKVQSIIGINFVYD